MNRRRFVSLSIMTAVGVVTAARLINPSSPKPIARLVNNSKGCWYNGNSDCVCEGEDALLYEPEEHVESFRRQVDELVKDGYAEYL